MDGATDARHATAIRSAIRFQFRLFTPHPGDRNQLFLFLVGRHGYRQNEPRRPSSSNREIAADLCRRHARWSRRNRRGSTRFGEKGLVDIASDANRMHMRRMVERLIAENNRRSRRNRPRSAGVPPACGPEARGPKRLKRG